MSQAAIIQFCCLWLTFYVMTSSQNEGLIVIETFGNKPYDQLPQISRTKRGSDKPGFFKTLFSVIGEQYSDTKDTFGKVNNMINNNFLPENSPKVTETTTSPSTDTNVTTTAAPYKITRSEFNRIIQRNLKGLIRLFNIELQDALKQSKVTQREYKKNVTKEVSKFL